MAEVLKARGIPNLFLPKRLGPRTGARSRLCADRPNVLRPHAPVGVTRPAGAQYALPSIEVYTASSRCPPLHKGSIGPDGRMSIKDELEARSESKTGNKS